MKKVLVASAVAVLAVPAMAQEMKLPTVYGQVNKAILYTTQKKEKNYSKMSNLVDVKGSESRLGAKGTHEINTLKVNYNLLMGLDSSDTVTSSTDPVGTNGTPTGRIRIRNAEVSMSDAWGTVFMGQTADIASVVGQKMDPLASTVVGQIGSDMSFYVKNATTNLGYIERSRVDQIGYKTPELMGLQLALANGKVAVDSTTVADDSNDDNRVGSTLAGSGQGSHAGNRMNALLSYNHAFNDMMKMEAYVGYNDLKAAAYKSYNDYLAAASFTYGEFTFNGEYTKLNKQNSPTATALTPYKIKETYIQAAVKWIHGDHIAALTFGNRKNEQDGRTLTSANENNHVGSTNGRYQQIAAGYMYNLNKYVQLRGVYAHYSVKTENTNGRTSATDAVAFKNSADVFSLGTLVTF